jgi:hypothetical protein
MEASLLERQGILSGVMRERQWRQLFTTGVTAEQAVERGAGALQQHPPGLQTDAQAMSHGRHRHHSLTNSCEQCPAAGLWRPTLNPPSVGRSFHPDAHEATGRRFSLELDLSGTSSR